MPCHRLHVLEVIDSSVHVLLPSECFHFCVQLALVLLRRLAAFLHPNNPGTTPAEALVGPFLSKHSRLQEVV